MAYYKPRLSRRRFLALASGTVASLGLPAHTPTTHAAGSYTVGVGSHTDAYEATLRAVQLSGSWEPTRIAGKRVIIKPNLVRAESASMGTTTDPQVVRAIVDLALQAGATQIQIVESAVNGPPFDACGYRFFETYDAQGRVSLVDLEQHDDIPRSIPNGLAYKMIHLPNILFGDDVYYITVAKLKVHSLSQVTLALKNQFGLPHIARYSTPTQQGRFGMHNRSVNQAVLDLNLARPCDFAVVDAMVGMERLGPWNGDPVTMNLVVAGNNALAVDHVCLDIMQIPLSRVLHMRYAAAYGLGPASLAEVTVNGDNYTPRAFVMPPQLPLIPAPRVTPRSYDPSAGNLSITFHVHIACSTFVEIVRYASQQTELTQVALVSGWKATNSGINRLTWAGLGLDGNRVPPGFYAVRIGAYASGTAAILYAFRHFEVI